MATTIPAGFATADNTGVPAGTTLTAYTGPMKITTDGTVIENKIINGSLDIAADNVTIRNCIITYNDLFGINVMGANVTVEYCDIKGPGYNGSSPSVISTDVGGGTFVGNDISGAEHGLSLGPGSAVVKDNYIHDLGRGVADAHIDGIWIGEADGMLIEHNTIISKSDGTANIFLQNYFGPISNVTINHNYLGGDPGYNIYVEGRLSGGPVTGVSITNNVIVKGHYDYYSVVDASPKLSGNVEVLPGAAVPTDPTTPTGSTPPGAPTIASFSQDSGVAGDGITNDNMLTLTGSAVANSTVKVFDGSTQIGTAAANNSGAWSYTTSALSDGSHNLTATVTNASGQTSAASTALALKIDTTAPNAPTIGTPTSNAAGAVNLTGTAEANSTVKVFDGATQSGTATANGSGAWSYATAALSTGSHSFTAKAMDAAGNTGAASAAAVANIAAPTSAPSAPTIASFSSDSGVAGDGITNDNTLTLTGSAVANSTVKVFDGATQIGTAAANGSGAWSYTTSALSDGSHNLTATVTNALGQTSTASTTLAVKIDTAAPNAPTIGAASNNASGGVNLATLAAANSAVDTSGGVNLTGTAEANSTVKVFDATTQIGTATANGSGVWSYATGALATGNHSFTAEAMDAAGNTGAASAAAVVNIAAPTPAPGAPTLASFSNDSGVVGDHITNDNTLTLTGTATANSSVKVFDGSTQVGTATANSSGAWSLTTTTLVDGSHSLTATTTTTSTPGTSPTVFQDFNPWSGNVSPDGIWRIAGTWSGTGGNTLQPGNVSFTNTYPGESDTGFMYLTVPAGSPLRGAELQSLTTPGYSYGYYEARIKTTDVKGGGVVSFFWIEQPNYGSHEWDVEFTLSDSWAGTTNPGRVSFTTHPLDNTQWVNLGFNPSQAFHDYGFLWTPGRIDFTVDGQIVRTVTDPNLKTDATGYIMMNTWSGNSNFGGGPPSQAATSVYDWVKFYSGATSIPADNTGSTGGTSTSTPFSVTIDTAAPSAPTIAASTSAANLASTRVEVLTGTAEANSTVTVFDGTTKLGTATAGSNGAWSYTTAALSTGSYSFTANAMDVAGNTSVASTALPVTVPPTSTAPGAPTIVSFSSDSGVVGDGITNDSTLALAGTAAANSTVKIFDGTAEIGTVTANSSGSWDYITSVLTNAKHVLTATETNSSGNTNAASSALAVTVDTVAPNAPVIASSAPANNNTFLLTGTAEANSTVKVFDGTTQIGTAAVSGNGAWSYTTAALTSGSHSFTANAMDAAGNPSVASAALSATMPASSGQNLVANGGFETGDYTGWTLGGNSANNQIYIAPTAFVLPVHGQTYAAGLGSMGGIDGTLSQSIAAVAEQHYTLQFWLMNSSGNSGPANDFAVKWNGQTLTAMTNAADFGYTHYTFDVVGINGTSKLEFDAYNNPDAFGLDDVTLTAVGAPAAPQPPAAPAIASFSTDSGKLGDGITNDNTLTLTGSAVANSTVKVFDGTAQIGTAIANSSGAWNYTAAALADGSHSLTAKDFDASGQSSATSSALAVTIDTHAATAPTMAVYSQGGTAIGSTTTADELLLRGTAEANSTVNIFDGGKQVGTATTNGSGLWSFDTGHVADGSHSFTSTAIDAAGNASAASSVKGVTVEAPTSAVGITDMYENSSGIVTIKGTADAYSQIQVYDGTKSVGMVGTAADGTWSFASSSAVSNTVHTFTAQELDSTGHVGASSGSAILGSTGRNTLTSTAGNDLFVGNGGHDTFVFAPNFGNDVINDFSAGWRGHDVIQFSMSVFDSFASVLAHATQVGQDVVIAADATDSLTLKNVKLAALDKTDFHFA